jgi:hypothetical protein
MAHMPITRMMVKLAAGKDTPAHSLAQCARFVRLATAIETTITPEEMETLLTRLQAMTRGRSFLFTPETGDRFATILEYMAVQVAAQDIMKEALR